jgi:hypothetical protein
MTEVNKKLGEKFEITDAELSSVVDACGQLLQEGVDLDLGEQASTVRNTVGAGLGHLALVSIPLA